jgi:hypothetical protein
MIDVFDILYNEKKKAFLAQKIQHKIHNKKDDIS